MQLLIPLLIVNSSSNIDTMHLLYDHVVAIVGLNLIQSRAYSNEEVLIQQNLIPGISKGFKITEVRYVGQVQVLQ